MNSVLRASLCCLLTALAAEWCSAERQVAEEFSRVTCGSAIRLVHAESNYYLHSHEIQWGSGSFQQSVTAHSEGDNANTLWLVKEGHGESSCEFGSPIKCGSTVRLEHVPTSKNVHTHNFASPLSQQKEVSAFGNEQGDGDIGDNFKVKCLEKTPGNYWLRASKVTLYNDQIKSYLHSHASFRFNQRNCGGHCPIMGQQEVTAFPGKNTENEWFADDGLFFTLD